MASTHGFTQFRAVRKGLEKKTLDDEQLMALKKFFKKVGAIDEKTLGMVNDMTSTKFEKQELTAALKWLIDFEDQEKSIADLSINESNLEHRLFLKRARLSSAEVFAEILFDIKRTHNQRCPPQLVSRMSSEVRQMYKTMLAWDALGRVENLTEEEQRAAAESRLCFDRMLDELLPPPFENAWMPVNA